MAEAGFMLKNNILLNSEFHQIIKANIKAIQAINLTTHRKPLANRENS